MNVKCIAIDDEPLALDIIQEYCNRFSFLQLEKTFDNGLDVVDYIKHNDIDLMFLDIQMEGLTGIQLLNVLKSRPKVIMTTAFESYALQGYELDVSDYLLKPISFERFALAVNKVYSQIMLEKEKSSEKSIKSEVVSSSNTESYIFVKADSKLIKVFLNDILYVEGQGDYLCIVTAKSKIMTLMNFSNLLGALPDNNFLRVHKSYIVSFDKIENIEKNRVLIHGKNIPVSDSYKKVFYEWVKDKEV